MITHEIRGNASQMVVCQLGEGQSVYCEAGKFLWTNLSPTSTLMPLGGSGLCAFAGMLPGEMREIQLDGSRIWTAEKDAFVAAESTIKFDIHFAGFKAGRRAGEGFILEKFSGEGSLFLAGAGNFIDLNPADYGDKIQVDTGCVVAFDDQITYGVERIGKFDTSGLTSAFFGGEGFSLATLEGNGSVILQSVSMVALARSLVGAAGEASTEGTAGSLRSILGGSTD